MMLEPWVVIAIGAALAQTTRNVTSQSLASRISPALNSWARFAFCLPFAGLAWLVVAGRAGFPALPASFFVLCAATATTQLLGNVALVNAFRRGRFGESVVLHKLEVPLTALFGALCFGEWPTLLGSLGVLVCAAGALAMNQARGDARGSGFAALRFGPSGPFALACAVLLVVASFALKAANGVVVTTLAETTRFEAAVHTLFHTTWIEVLLLTTWLRIREPGAFGVVGRYWPRMLLVGSTSFTASLGWFWSFSLTLVAYVKAVGQIEALIAVAIGIFWIGERGLARQLPGIALVAAGILLVLLG